MMAIPYVGYSASITSNTTKPILPKSKFVEYEESDLWWLKKYYGWKDSIPIHRWDFQYVSSLTLTPIPNYDNYNSGIVEVTFIAKAASISDE